MITIILALITAILTGAAITLQKAGLNKTKKTKDLIKNKTWIIGIILSGVPAILYTWLLSVEEVSIITPLVSLSLAVILFNGYYFLNEKLTRKQLIGAACLITGSIIMGLIM